MRTIIGSEWPNTSESKTCCTHIRKTQNEGMADKDQTISYASSGISCVGRNETNPSSPVTAATQLANLQGNVNTFAKKSIINHDGPLIPRHSAKPSRAPSHSPARRKCARSSCDSRWKSNSCCLQMEIKVSDFFPKRNVTKSGRETKTINKRKRHTRTVPQGFCAQSRTAARRATPKAVSRQCRATEDKTRAGICDVTPHPKKGVPLGFS